MSENGEIYTADKNFTLPPAVTAWTNSTSAKTSIWPQFSFCSNCTQSIFFWKLIIFKPIWRPFQFHGVHWVAEQWSRSYFEAPPAHPAVVEYVYFDFSSWSLPAEGCWGPPTLSLIILRMSCPSSVTAVLEDHVRCHDALPKCVWIYRYNVTIQNSVFFPWGRSLSAT